MNRKPYVFILLAVVLIIALFTPQPKTTSHEVIQRSGGFVLPVSTLVQEQSQIAALFFAFIMNLLVLPAHIMRLKDLNYSPWLAVLMVANYLLLIAVGYLHFPNFIGTALGFATLILLLILLFKRGTAGPNRYGPNPLYNLKEI